MSTTLKNNEEGKKEDKELKKIMIHGKEVLIDTEINNDDEKAKEEIISLVMNAAIFIDWKNSLDDRFDIKSITIQSIDMFGKKIGFIKMKTMTFLDGNMIPGIVFLRGGAISILIKIICTDNEKKEYSLLCVQPRLPIGDIEFKEIPAGMLDGEQNFIGMVAKEMKEETGIVIDSDKLINLSDLVINLANEGKNNNNNNYNNNKGFYPSPGGCDEYIKFYYYEYKCNQIEINEMEGKCTGNLDEGERIKLKIVAFDQLWKETTDMKTLSALCLYHHLEKNNLLPSLSDIVNK